MRCDGDRPDFNIRADHHASGALVNDHPALMLPRLQPQVLDLNAVVDGDQLAQWISELAWFGLRGVRTDISRD